MSTSQVPQNAGGTGANESTEDEITIRTRLFYPLFGIAVIIGVILDVFILILLNTYVPGRARTPFWIFIIPIAILVFLVSFVDDVLAKRFPNLVPEGLRRQLAAAEAAKAGKAAGAPQQQGYPQMPGNPMPAQAAPQQQQQPYPGAPSAQPSNGQPQYGQPAAQQMAPQSAGYGQVPGQQAAQTAPQPAPYGQPQQPGQVPPSGQYGQDPQNQQPYGQAGQPGQTGPVGY